MKKLSIIFVFCLLLVFIFFNCKKESSYEYSSDTKKESYSPEMSTSYDKKKSSKDELSDEESSGSNIKPTDTSKQDVDKLERKRIKTGTVNYEINDLTNIEKAVEKKVKQFGGYVANANFSLSNGTMQIKIPANTFDDFVSIVGDFGKVTSKTINVEDVTLTFYDQENRIKTKKILLDRLQTYLSQARNVEELIKLETEINNVTEQLESMEGNFKNLSYLIGYSTLTLNFYVPSTTQFIRSLPSLKRGFNELLYNFIDFIYGLLFVILYIVVFGIPILLLIGLIYLLTFGKIGLLKKFFKFLSARK
ncbi:MAG: hypothetical protein A2Y34_05645 [Spirochaetes bacterium GWC1_27_15]|nr:MAG: hypothetical protein A2Z98_11855 [Spirochaetes bacterium GWB1_27_13]OHD28116.1 MAG: hypothetical protein A2Y34_05645 [Spirochaetes bacterium GWC1_27_15]